MKKTFYLLLVAIVFTMVSASENEVSEDAKDKSEIIENIEVEDNIEAPTLDLTPNEKVAYYEQYLQIVREANALYPEAGLELVPFNEFTYWVPLEVFRQMVIGRANMEIIVEP